MTLLKERHIDIDDIDGEKIAKENYNISLAL